MHGPSRLGGGAYLLCLSASCESWGGVFILSPLSPQQSSSFTTFQWPAAFPLSSIDAPTSLGQNLSDSLRVFAKESMGKQEKIKLLHSWALGEALAAWCICYSWSLAPRWLKVARELPTCCGWAPGICIALCDLVEPSNLLPWWWVGEEERVERDSIALVASSTTWA